MMEKIRAAANNIIVKIIFGIIMLAFIFTGVGGFFGFGSSAKDEQLYIAKVDDEGLSRNTFERQAQEIIQQNSHLMGSGDDQDSFIKMIRNSVLSRQIDDYLSYKFAESLNTNISDELIKQAIRKQSVFFENGVFNNQRYLQLLAANGYTPDAYAASMRSSIKQQQVMDALLLSDFILPIDSEISLLDNQTRAVSVADYSIVNVDNKTLAVTDDEVKNYYDNNQQEFYHDKRVKVQFVANSLPTIQQETQISDAEVEKYYADGKEGSMSPERHLYSVLSFDSLDAAEKEYTSLNSMQDKQRLSAKMDNLGWFALGEQLPELLTKIKLDNIGGISKPLAQDGTYYIIRLDQIEKAKKLPFEYAKKSIHDSLYLQKTDKQYREQQANLEKAAKLPTMVEIAKASGLQLHDSDWIYEKESTSIGSYPEINMVAFGDEMIKDGKPAGKISDIIHVTQDDGSYIIQVTDYQDAGVSAFGTVKEAIRAKLLTEKRKQIFSQKVDMLLAQLKQTGTADGLSFGKSIPVTQNLVDDRIDGKTVQDVFAVVPAVTGNSYGVSLIGDDKAQFFILSGVTFPEKADDLTEKLKSELIISTNQSLAKDLRSKAEIKIMPNANL